MSENTEQWEKVNETPSATTERLKVSGGWLYYVDIHPRRNTHIVFVPDNSLEVFAHHIKDAYNQGYQAAKKEMPDKAYFMDSSDSRQFTTTDLAERDIAFGEHIKKANEAEIAKEVKEALEAMCIPTFPPQQLPSCIHGLVTHCSICDIKKKDILSNSLDDN